MCLLKVHDKNPDRTDKVIAYKAVRRVTSDTFSPTVVRKSKKVFVLGQTMYDHPLAKHFPRLARLLQPKARRMCGEKTSYRRGFHAFSNRDDARRMKGYYDVVVQVELTNIVAVGRQDWEDFDKTYVALEMKILKVIE